MPRDRIPPHAVRVLTAWGTTATTRELGARLDGDLSQREITAVRVWAEMMGCLKANPPRGCRLTPAGREWLWAIEDGAAPAAALLVVRKRARKRNAPRDVQRRVLLFIQSNPRCTVAEIAEHFGVCREHARTSCDRLRRAGRIYRRQTKAMTKTSRGMRPTRLNRFYITKAGRKALKEAA